MGIDAIYVGSFRVRPRLSAVHRLYLERFAAMRHMTYAEERLAGRPDPLREAVGLPLGNGGAYFVGGECYGGAPQDEAVLNGNVPPGTPSVWCHWVPNPAGTRIEWNGLEKFTDAADWMRYLVKHFFGTWGYSVAGSVWYAIPEFGNGTAVIRVTDGVVREAEGAGVDPVTLRLVRIASSIKAWRWQRRVEAAGRGSGR